MGQKTDSRPPWDPLGSRKELQVSRERGNQVNQGICPKGDGMFTISLGDCDVLTTSF